MEIFKLLKGRPLRIMKLLGASWKGGVVSVSGDVKMDVTTIVNKLYDGSQSSVSQDLARMRNIGVVVNERQGLHIFYRLSDDFSEMMNSLGKPEVAIKRHNALERGKNRKPIVAFLKANPNSKSADICPSMDRSTVSHELAILRKAGVLSVEVVEKKKVYSIKE